MCNPCILRCLFSVPLFSLRRNRPLCMKRAMKATRSAESGGWFAPEIKVLGRQGYLLYRGRSRPFIPARVQLTLIFVVAFNLGLADLRAADFVGLSGSADNTQVGDKGDLDQIEFLGATTFTPQALRDALSSELRFLLLSHRQAPLAEFLETLQQKVLAGYQYDGFPDAKVAAAIEPDTGHVRVKISEGTRYRCGKVQVTGAKPEATAAIVARLSRPATGASKLAQAVQNMGKPGSGAPKEGASVTVETYAEIERSDPRAALAANRPASDEPPLWLPGEPGAFGEEAEGKIKSIVKDCLAEDGLFFPRVSSSVKLDPGSGTADLLVQVLDEGPQGTVSQLEVIGNEKNTREEILDFLGLKPGMAITRSRVAEAEQKLWRSARFVQYEITPEPAASGMSKATSVRLSIRVQEYDLAPKLAAPLSAEQQAMVRLCNWMSDFASRPEDLEIAGALSAADVPVRGSADFVLSPSQGAVLRLRDSPKSNGMDYALLLATNAVGVYGPKSGGKFLGQFPGTALCLLIAFAPSSGSNRFSLSIGGGFRTALDEDSKSAATPPFDLRLTLAPAAFLSLLDDTNLQIEAKGGSLALVSSNQVLRLDAATGRLKELAYHSPNGSFEVRFAKGAFEQARRTVDAATAGFSNRYDPSHPLSSLVAFGAVEVARSSLLDRVITNRTQVQRERAVTALNKLFGPTVLAPLEQALGTNNPSHSFSIPADEADLALAQNSLSAFLAAFGFRYCNGLFPRNSWPWTLARESVFLLAHQHTYTGAELERLHGAEGTGPMGCLVIGEVLARMGLPAAKAFGFKGLTLLSANDFLSDCRLFLEGESGLARTFSNMAVVLRDMPPEEVDALAAMLPTEEAGFLRNCAQALRAAPALPLSASLRPALEKYWNQSLRARVRTALRNLSVTAPSLAEPRT